MNLSRLHLEIRGRVQGLGFRPFLWNLAHQLQLKGWVRNTAEGVQVEVEGSTQCVQEFLGRLEKERPPHAQLDSVTTSWLPRRGYGEFQILESGLGKKTAAVLPDLATCAECVREIQDPHNRRFRYPFTNCTHCGPRFSILEALPYDRKNTTMKRFAMCATCRAEYEDPKNRRFHAQPNACWDCGPILNLKDETGNTIALGEAALQQAETALQQGKSLAVKGLGGFHLMVDARNAAAVERLRQSKHRPEKPFALMFPHLKMVQDFTELSDLQRELLQSPAAPIVLIKQTQSPLFPLAKSVAPENPYYGILLPYSPLHHLLMKDLGFPLIATSGNRSEEPICIDGAEAMERLHGIADLFLDHDRPIVRPVEDSVVRIIANTPTLLRRSRGYAPQAFRILEKTDPILATGGQLKNTVAVALENQVILSQHLGDLETLPAQQAFAEALESFQKFYAVQPKKIVCDLHPDYAGGHWAQQNGEKVIKVQHHHAHVVAAMAEHGLEGNVLGVAWDGIGYGTDGTLWGSEFLHCTRQRFQRLGHLRYFPLPGGAQAIREPRRAALGLLYEIFGASLFSKKALLAPFNFSQKELALLHTMLEKNLNTPQSCGLGRLFDAVAALLNLKQKVSFEGQAAMKLEFLASDWNGLSYPLELRSAKEPFLLDWEPMVREILGDLEQGLNPQEISQKFHRGLIEGILQGALHVGAQRVVLTGGCFQNQLLCEGAVARLREAGFQPYWPQKIPPGDGGIALGQAVIACV